MVVIMKPGFTEEQLASATRAMEEGGVKVMISKGSETTILGAEGDASRIDQEKVSLLPGVERVMRVTEPYKKANRKFHPDDTVVDLGNGSLIGGEKLAVIAGPCSVESKEQITEVAKAVKTSGASALRGGAYKPRTSPYAFQGLAQDGIKLLQEAKAATGLPIVTEIMSTDNIEMFDMCVDVIQVGARNMQNFDLLKQLGKTRKPILLKRGLSSTIEEWLMSAEYILAGGNHNVILCERGIRTFETFTRNTLDLSAVLAVKKLSHLPVVVDPSHACGQAWMVERMSLAAVAAGADGLIIEVHNDPPHALCDGAQSITPGSFDSLMGKIGTVAACVGRTV
ncbi:MAG: 3-deoxy-7-phosphoheptulonate synthase [Clostridia bacterium]|nr:3-deoxy-7-phosphoheptulonate synthase [Clostridia bacterium]